jgi:hypothetical protein
MLAPPRVTFLAALALATSVSGLAAAGPSDAKETKRVCVAAYEAG